MPDVTGESLLLDVVLVIAGTNLVFASNLRSADVRGDNRPYRG
jgi:hypothetical protein